MRFRFVLPAVLALVILRIGFVEIARVLGSDERKLNFTLSGSGPPVVILHGLFGSLRYWQNITPEISRTHQVLALDLLGFGDSPKPNIEYSVKDHVGAIEESIAAHLAESEKLVLVGHSMGAILALNYAISHPTRIKQMVLISPPVVTSSMDLQNDLSHTSSKFMMYMTFNHFGSQAFCRFHEYFPFLMYPMMRILEPNLPRVVAEDASKHTWESFSGSYRNVLTNQRFAELMAQAPIVPILILEGAEDIHTKAELLNRLAEKMPNVKLSVIQGGHNFILEEPGAAISEIQTFLDSRVEHL